MKPLYKQSLLALVCATALSVLSLAAFAAEPKSDPVSDDKVEKVVQDSEQAGSKEKAGEASDGKTGEVGESSYNIENCEALIKEAEEGGSMKPGAESHDLDKCHQLIK